MRVVEGIRAGTRDLCLRPSGPANFQKANFVATTGRGRAGSVGPGTGLGKGSGPGDGKCGSSGPLGGISG